MTTALSTDQYRALQARDMTEAHLRDRLIIPAARALIWRVYFTHRSEHSPSGFPDLVLAHSGTSRLVVAELKREGKRLRPDQWAWLTTLKACGCETAVWRPSDWLSGTITAVLSGEPCGSVEGEA